MGNLTVTNLTFNDNAVFDWEISDFNSGANQSSFNDEFGALNFDTLTFGSGAEVDLNIFSVASNGSAGGVANLGVHDHTTNDGIIFLKRPIAIIMTLLGAGRLGVRTVVRRQ